MEKSILLNELTIGSIIEEDIKTVARCINEIYKIGKINNLWKQKIKENQETRDKNLVFLWRNMV